MEELHLEYYAVAFLDVLGQRDVLRSLNEIPTTREEQEHAVQVLKKTVGTIRGFRTLFEEYFKGATEQREVPPGLPSSLRAMLEEPPRVIRYGLSDAMVLAVPLGGEKDRHFALQATFHTLLSACAVMQASLVAGQPLRGAIEVAPAICVDGEIFGPALAHAYDLESHFAEYPRVLLGTGFHQFLSAFSSGTWQQTREDQLAAGFAQTCAKLWVTDTDGRPILDYFGEAACDVTGRSLIADNFYKAIAKVSEEHERMKRMGNEKLRARYYRLLRYLQSRRPLFDEPKNVD